MSKRFDNKRLIFLLAALTAILLLTILVKIPREKSTLKDVIFDFDSSEVSSIILYPRISNGSPVEFTRNNNRWTVKEETITANIRKGAVQNIFLEVMNLKPQSLAAVNKSKWKDFEVTDSLATRIKFLSKKKKVLGDLLIGKFSYKQAANPYGGYGNNNIQGTSYVRLAGQKEIYAVDGFIPFSLNRKFDDWRDNTFIDLKKEDITNLSFIYPADTSFKLTKKELIWYAGSQPADSISIAGFLNSLGYLNGEEFINNFKPVTNPVYQLHIEGNNLLNISVKCYMTENNNDYILNSSLNPEAWFVSKKNGIFEKLFKPENYFVR